jgi:hypothetical protein
VLFNNTKESLLPLIEKLSRGNMKFARDLDKRYEKLGKELPGDFRQEIEEESKK